MDSNRIESDNQLETDGLCADILGWIATDETQMNRFLALSGLSADTLRQAAAEPGFHAGVLGFLMSHEPTLIAYCNDRDILPERVAEIWQALEGQSPFEGSP